MDCLSSSVCIDYLSSTVCMDCLCTTVWMVCREWHCSTTVDRFLFVTVTILVSDWLATSPYLFLIGRQRHHTCFWLAGNVTILVSDWLSLSLYYFTCFWLAGTVTSLVSVDSPWLLAGCVQEERRARMRVQVSLTAFGMCQKSTRQNMINCREIGRKRHVHGVASILQECDRIE